MFLVPDLRQQRQLFTCYRTNLEINFLELQNDTFCYFRQSEAKGKMSSV